MQFSTVAMILTAAVAHAVWNIASKYKREDTLVFVWAYSCASALLWLPFSLILIVEGQQELDWRLAVGAVISSALHIAYSLILQAGYERAELGVVYPIARGSGPVLTILFATLLMGERISFSLSPAIRSGAEADHYRECFGGQRQAPPSLAIHSGTVIR